MEMNLKKNMYMYNWITFLYTWNIVNQLYFNLKIKIKKKKNIKTSSNIWVYLYIVLHWLNSGTLLYPPTWEDAWSTCSH